MDRFRFSLKWLLASVAFIALACASLINASPFWEKVVISLAWCLLLISLLAGIFRRGRPQMFAIGFAICGSAYLLLAFHFESKGLTAEPSLTTTALLRTLYPAIRREVPEVQSIPPAMPAGSPGMGGPRPIAMKTVPKYWLYIRIGQWLWAIAIAFMGGLLARCFYSMQEQDRRLRR